MIKAKFIGTTSCGFITGQEYELNTSIKGNLIFLKDVNGRGCCLYRSIETVLDNWEVL